MATVTCRTFAEMGVARRTWQAAWAPAETILRYSVGGVVLGMILLLPAAIVLNRTALVVPLLLTSGGITVGYLRLRSSQSFVNEEFGAVLCDSCSIRREAGVDSTVYTTRIAATETQDGVTPASRYSLSLVEEASEFVLISDVEIDARTFEVTTNTTKIPTERVNAREFSNGTYRLESSRGTWTISGLSVWSREQFSVDDWKGATGQKRV